MSSWRSGTRLGFNSTLYSATTTSTSDARDHPGGAGADGDRSVLPGGAGHLGRCGHGGAGQLTRGRWRTPRHKAEVEAWTAQTFQTDRCGSIWHKRDADADSETHPTQPSGLFKEPCAGCLPKDAAITMDAGTLCLQATDALNYWTPKTLFTPLDFGLVGFSFACGLGIKCARPDAPVVSLMGDGGFGMTISELSTAVDHNINTVTVVMNNQCWGAEKAYQRDFFNGRYIGADVSSPAFDKAAELYGAAGFRADRLSDVQGAVDAALACGKPAVVDVAVDPAALYSFRRDSFKHRGG